MPIRNKQTLQWLDEQHVTQSELESIMGCASPDCREATLIVDWGIHALEIIEALEMELDHYAHLAGQSNRE